MTRRLCIFVCQSFAAEIKAAAALEGLEDVAVMSFPAHCQQPGEAWEYLRDAARPRANCSQVDVIGSACLMRAESPPPDMGHCRVHQIDLCFDLCAPHSLNASYLDQGAYLLTPGWLQRWRAQMDAWGFDRQTAREYFNESVTRLVLLDTGTEAKSGERLQALADFLDLPCEVVPVGLDFTRLFLTEIVLTWRLQEQERQSNAALAQATQQSADYALAFDALGSLSRVMTEQQAIDHIAELVTALFAPKSVVYVPLRAGKASRVRSWPDATPVSTEAMCRLQSFDGAYAWTESKHGFRLRVGTQDDIQGILEIEGLAFPQYKERYLNLALTIVSVLSLAISNARSFEQLEAKVEARTRELRDAQEQLLRREKLAVLGQLAGGVGHDLRNPLGVISNAVYLLKVLYGDDETTREYLDIINGEVARAEGIVSDLLDFARTREPDRQPVDVHALVADALLQQPPPDNVTVITDIPPDLPPAFVDPRQIGRVLTNLISNAYQAMPDGGRLSVNSEQTGDGILDTGYWVLITVSDTGVGISPEHMEKLFEPLFTTKARGIGLGLATSKNLVEANGGRIEVESQVGKGSTFTVWLPAKESVS